MSTSPKSIILFCACSALYWPRPPSHETLSCIWATERRVSPSPLPLHQSIPNDRERHPFGRRRRRARANTSGAAPSRKTRFSHRGFIFTTCADTIKRSVGVHGGNDVRYFIQINEQSTQYYSCYEMILCRLSNEKPPEWSNDCDTLTVISGSPIIKKPRCMTGR